MRTIQVCCVIVSAVASLVLQTPSAHAITGRAFISATGSNTTDCSSETAPCKTLAFAVGQIVNGGEVICLSGGDFGGFFTIDKSVTIDCGAGVGASGIITINGSGIVVKLRNLMLTTQSSTTNLYGINAVNMAALFIEGCHIVPGAASEIGFGISFTPPDGVTAKLFVKDTIISNKGFETGGGGILVQPTGSGSARVVIDRSRIENNTLGIVVDGSNSTGRSVVEINDSLIAGSLANGISVKQAGMVINRTSVEGNAGNGILAGPGALIHIGASTVAANSLAGLAYNGGQILSYGDNKTKGNGADNEPSGMLSLK